MMRMIIIPILQREKPCPREGLFQPPAQARVRNCCYISISQVCPCIPTPRPPGSRKGTRTTTPRRRQDIPLWHVGLGRRDACRESQSPGSRTRDGRYLCQEAEQLLLGERDEPLAVLLGPVAGLRGVPHLAVLPHLGRQRRQGPGGPEERGQQGPYSDPGSPDPPGHMQHGQTLSLEPERGKWTGVKGQLEETHPLHLQGPSLPQAGRRVHLPVLQRVLPVPSHTAHVARAPGRAQKS